MTDKKFFWRRFRVVVAFCFQAQIDNLDMTDYLLFLGFKLLIPISLSKLVFIHCLSHNFSGITVILDDSRDVQLKILYFPCFPMHSLNANCTEGRLSNLNELIHQCS